MSFRSDDLPAGDDDRRWAGGDAVLTASIFHFGQHTIGEANVFLTARGLEIPLIVCRRS